MRDRPPVLLSYPVVMGYLVVLTLGLVLLGQYFLHLGLATFYLLAVPLALAVGYLAWYRTFPYEPAQRRPSAGPGPTDEDEEPFEDPVEEADRYDDEKQAAEDSEPEETPEPDESADATERKPPEDGATD